MLDPSSALILFALFQATEKIIGYAGGKIADAMTQPVWDAAEEHAKWLAGKDDTARRWQAFGQAFAEARARFERDAPNPDVARRVSGVLEKLALKPDADREWLARLAPELEKASLISERPDASVVAYLLASAFEKGDGVAPSRADLADATAVFVSAFQDRLFAQPAYQELMLRRAWWEQLRQPRYDTRERYLAQLIDCNQDLDFVGIPELKDRQALRIEDVFIHLQAEVQLEPERGALVERIARGEEFGERLAETAERLTRYPRETLKRRLAANAALREYPRMAVLGDPGAGKTTLLKYIAIAFAQMQSGKLGLNEDRLPIFVRLYDYVAKQAERQADYSLVDYLYTQARETLLLTLEPGFFESALERGECCVCLDGLDELGGAGLRREVTAAVEALANKYPRNRYLVTSRSVGYEEAPLDRREFVHHTILPLSDDDIRAFVPKWYAAREKNPAVARERAEHLTKTIMAEPRIKSLAANPLMLTIIALVHRIEAELPHERVKLYDKCVTALVETWEEVKRLRVEDRQRPYYKHRRRLLEQLAGWMHAQPGESGRAREVKEGDLELQLRRFLLDNPKLQLDDEDARQEAQAFIGLAKGRTGLLVERGEGIYAFAHLTFQEYLAAADIERRLVHNIDAMWDEIQPRLHDPHWREVILLLLGSLNRFEKPPTELVSRIFKRTDEYEDVLHRHLLLAARALADRVEVDVALRDAIVDRLLAIARSDELAQYDALAALGSLQGNSRAAAGLLALARDAQVEGWVRSAAALALGQLGRADEAASILLALARDAQVEGWVRSAAAHALGQSGRADEAVLSGLLALARDAQVDAWVRSDAAQALGQLGRADEAVLSGLLALARDAQVEGWVRSAAALALGQLGRADEAASILLALARDAQVEGWVRSAAAQALGQSGRADEAASILLALARDAQVDAGVRSDAAHALGQLGRADEAVLSGLLALARDAEVDAWVRSAAAHALGPLGRADEAASILLALARDAQVAAGVRRAAAPALGQLGRADEAVVSGLLALARDAQVDAGVRRAAYDSLKALLRGERESGG